MNPQLKVIHTGKTVTYSKRYEDKCRWKVLFSLVHCHNRLATKQLGFVCKNIIPLSFFYTIQAPGTTEIAPTSFT